jgi:hypothetical protein
VQKGHSQNDVSTPLNKRYKNSKYYGWRCDSMKNPKNKQPKQQPTETKASKGNPKLEGENRPST